MLARTAVRPLPHRCPRRLALAPVAAALALAVTVTACLPHGVLVADDGDHRLTARDPEGGVTVVLTSGVWNGRPASLPQEWTVLHVLVANLGTKPLLLAPGDLELRDERGFEYELYDVGGAFEVVDPNAPGGRYGRVDHRNYDPGGPIEFEPIVAPAEVASRALPWGVLEPGTQMRGFLYFEPVEDNANAATLTWHFTRPDHVPVVDLQFPLRVARPSRAD